MVRLKLINMARCPTDIKDICVLLVSKHSQKTLILCTIAVMLIGNKFAKCCKHIAKEVVYVELAERRDLHITQLSALSALPVRKHNWFIMPKFKSFKLRK